MQPKFLFPFLVLSVLAALGFAGHWLQDQNRTHRLTVATGSRDGEYHAFATALAQVVARHQPQIKISVLETVGAQKNLSLLDQKQAQLAIIQSDTPSRPSVRAVAYLFPEVFHLIARPESGIQSMKDLRGKRVALMPKGSGSFRLFWEVAAHYDFTPQDLTSMPMQPTEAYQALSQGRVDALFRVMALGNPAMADFLTTTQTQLIPIDQRAALKLSLPYLEEAQIPEGTYNGVRPIPAADLSTMGVRAVLIAHEQVDPAVVQEITRTLFEFRNEIVELYPRSATMRLPDAGENLGLPLHPGAKAYYDRERPSFLVEYADVLGLGFSVGVLLVSGLWQLRLWLEKQQKNRADSYNQDLLELIQRMETSQDIQELEQIRRQLFEILHKVVTDLDKDRISPESFQSFTFPWEVAVTSLRHREMIVLQAQGTLPSSLPS
jgi:uncharacterized protein